MANSVNDFDAFDAAIEAAAAQAHAWIAETAEEDANDSQTQQLAALLRDDDGVRFTMDFVDRVMRPEDDRVAARALRSITSGIDASFLGQINGLLVGLGAFVGPILPKVVIPAARARLRQLVGHLVLDAESDALNGLLDRAAERGEELNLNLLGEAVLGEGEATDRAERTGALIRNPRVTYVSVKASSMVAQLNPWDFDGSVERVKDRIRPLYRAARDRSPRVFLNMDMEEYHDLHLTIAVFTQLLAEEEFRDYEGGIVLQAYLPDTLAALEELAEFATQRVAAGGAKIKIRLVKGANLSMERAHAELQGWPQAPYPTKQDVDANYYRLLDTILRPEFADAISIGVATHNLFTAAFAKELAAERGVSQMIDSEMLQGMSPAQQTTVRRAYGRQILYTPVVHKEDFDVAVSYLVRRLEENAAPQNFLYALFAPDEPGHAHGELTPLKAQEQVFRNAVATRHEVPAGPRHTQDRAQESARATASASAHAGRFLNEPDTNPALRANREWAIEHLTSPPALNLGEEVHDTARVDEAVRVGVEKQKHWGALSADERATVLEAVGDVIAARRGDFIATAANEAGKTVDQTDPEISEAIDFCAYYADSARRLADIRGRFEPNRLTVVVPPWNFPVAIPTGGIMAALAAGSAVIVKPAPQVTACAKLIVDCIHEAFAAHNIDPNTVQYLRADEAEAGKRLITHEDVDAIILTGASDTAQLFTSWKPQLNVMAETSGKNALIITPSADPDLAIADLYQSAFGHSGQKCSAASLVIFVGAAGDSERLRNQLLDATSTLKVGPGTDITTSMNGLIEAPGEKLRRGLTQLEPGETWLLEPKQLDDEGRYWSPGIRDGVQPGSWFHLNECFGPVLGIMHARDLDEAIEWQNSTGYGLTAGLHTLDGDEINYWLERVEAGNVYVNRGITGAIVQRQPFGGWKKSSVGPGAKAGGPNYVAQMGTWHDVDVPSPGVSVAPHVAEVLRGFADHVSEEDFGWLSRAAEYDELAWQREFGREHDYAGLRSEANIYRYRPLLEPLVLYVGEGFALRDVYRQLLAAARTGTQLRVIAPDSVAPELRDAGVHVDGSAVTGTPSRVRVIGAAPESLYGDIATAVLDWPVLADGRRELLPYLHEQAISATLHRFGVLRDPAGLRNN
ncbi:bifunctional proline dehydrogenase/L-glutamate gamma-semialdehyde dehydrogenase [Corynebacterium sp. p3-SID1056]|uniref:bifunctional proline dehydrogenase/L-glutamate gamma-semialdehyde dehydrogenase n=1 Tax=Corynebacterium sp. p3-SID1056 TaxID=2916092 RepID=UPI0021A64B35|nr:bifunctional proline dehydrogenase/L-glutamate gamma-semialdehyde dehydrogenase [Corynebacterium sp. p3-SID1056]MCT2337744.1 bifunctional proline dehydrogenase/L-glutamate gamma-semialdehyde dehydrogenase [Corynebacterium sp. p3-SID1056]